MMVLEQLNDKSNNMCFEFMNSAKNLISLWICQVKSVFIVCMKKAKALITNLGHSKDSDQTLKNLSLFWAKV